MEEIKKIRKRTFWKLKWIFDRKWGSKRKSKGANSPIILEKVEEWASLDQFFLERSS